MQFSDVCRFRSRVGPASDRPWLRVAGLAYGVAAFVGTWVFFTWFVIFLGNLPKRSAPWVDPTVDRGASADPWIAALVNAGLLSLFCLQHSVMARPWFKRALARFLPPDLERATYVHAANATGFLFLSLWMPIPMPLWSLDHDIAEAAVWVAFGAGWLLLFLSALSMNVTELLGLRQAWAWYRGRPHRPLTLKTAWLYRYLEHPMYVGVALGFWMTPHMTLGHALLASLFTLYLVIGMSYERRDLRAKFGTAYVRWRREGAAGVVVPVSVGAPIARELARRLDPIVREPLPQRMTFLLGRL